MMALQGKALHISATQSHIQKFTYSIYIIFHNRMIDGSRWWTGNRADHTFHRMKIFGAPWNIKYNIAKPRQLESHIRQKTGQYLSQNIWDGLLPEA